MHTTAVATSAAFTQQEIPPLAEGVGFWPRAFARLLDVSAALLVSVTAGGLAGVCLAVSTSLGTIDDRWMAQLDKDDDSTLLGLLIGLVMHVLCVAFAGASPGKLLLGMRVVDVDGNRPGFVAALVRELGFFVDGLFFGIPAYTRMQQSPLHQRYGDAWANTVVVSRHETGIRNGRSMPRVVLGIGIALACSTIFTAAGFAVHLLCA